MRRAAIASDRYTGATTITCHCGWRYTSTKTRRDPSDTDRALHAEHEYHLRTTSCGEGAPP